MAGIESEKRLYYHGLKEQKKLDVSRLKYLSLLISIIGVAVLLVAAQTAQAPLIKVNDVYGSYLMNYAVVRINGTVVSVPYVSDSGGRISITFTVDDGTGQIDVRVYSPLAEEMIAKNLVPFPGDNVTAEVQLRVRETYTYAILQYLDGLEFVSKVYSDSPEKVSSLTPEMANLYVAVEGIVTQVSNVSSGLLLTVDTGESEVAVLVPRVLLVENNVTLKTGDTVYAPGIVYLYKGSSPEIVVRDIDKFHITPIEEAPEVPLAEASNYIGMVLSVKGELAGISYESGRYVLTLTDGTNYFDALLPRDVLAKLDPFEVGTESVVKVAGRIGDDGRLVGAYVEVIEPNAPKVIPIGALTEDMRGQIVIVRGNIEEIATIGSNLNLYIDDGTGKLVVFIPSASVAEFSNMTKDNLQTGLGVEVAGYLDQYRNELEVVVYTGNGVHALGRPLEESEIELPQVTADELDSYVGSLVDFTGSLEGITYENYTYYLKIDGVTVSIPKEELMNLNPLEVGTGSEVKVMGLVVSATEVRGKDLTIVKPVEPTPMSPSEITLEMRGQLVLVIGKVTDVANLSGNLKIVVGDLPVFVPRSTANELSYVPEVGDVVKVGGYVEEYRGEPEVVVFTPNAVVKAELGGEAQFVTVSDLKTAQGLVWLVVKWDTLAYEKPNYIMSIRDETGKASLVVDRTLLPNPLEAGTGSELKVTVDPTTMDITTLEVVKAVPAELISTGSVSLGLSGKTVAVNGTVISVVQLGTGLKMMVDDGSGEVAVFIPSTAGSVEVRKGNKVIIAGYVEEYNGEPEIVVYTADAIRVAESSQGEIQTVTLSELEGASGLVNLTVTWDALAYKGPEYIMNVSDDTGSASILVSKDLLPNPFDAGTGSVLELTYDTDSGMVVSLKVIRAEPSPEVKTGDVSADIMGRTVIVSGTIVDLYEGSTFFKLTIDDGSGELVIFIPKSAAGDKTFSKDQVVRIAGYVTEYKGTIEVVPYMRDAIIVE